MDLDLGPETALESALNLWDTPKWTSVQTRSVVRTRERADWPNDGPSGIKLGGHYRWTSTRDAGDGDSCKAKLMTSQ